MLYPGAVIRVGEDCDMSRGGAALEPPRSEPESERRWPAGRRSERRRYLAAQDAVDAVFPLSHSPPASFLSPGMASLAFPEFTPQDAADGTHWGREEEGGAND